MSRHTTFKIGGPARLFIIPRTAGELERVSGFCNRNGMPLLVVGNGSNLLVSDHGIDGAVVGLTGGLKGIRLSGAEITCEAGTQLSEACVFARNHGLTGLEFAYGIPGSVGGAVYMNAGAYGGEMKDVVVSASHIGENGIGQYENDKLDFSYRHSAYSGTTNIITEVRLRLDAGDSNKISEKMRELMERRKQKQPLEYPSAGSVFKRPPGHFAGTLIESCGLKGLRVGGAAVSEKHAGFIINTGGASCKDVLTLIDKIKDEVFKKTGVELESEIKVVG